MDLELSPKELYEKDIGFLSHLVLEKKGVKHKVIDLEGKIVSIKENSDEEFLQYNVLEDKNFILSLVSKNYLSGTVLTNTIKTELDLYKWLVCLYLSE